jgi:RNA polymerase sigma-70 factor, ECF subfamily
MRGTDDDYTVWERARQGDARALQSLRHKYYAEVCRFIKRRAEEVEADEIEDRVWLAVWEARERFRGDSTFKTWLFAIAKNQTLDAIRREQARQRTTDNFIQEQAFREQAENAPTHGENRIVERLALHYCLKKLEIKLQEVIVLCYVLQLNDVAIAERLTRPLGTVKSQIQTAKRQMRICLQAGEESYQQ